MINRVQWEHSPSHAYVYLLVETQASLVLLVNRDAIVISPSQDR